MKILIDPTRPIGASFIRVAEGRDALQLALSVAELEAEVANVVEPDDGLRRDSPTQ